MCDVDAHLRETRIRPLPLSDFLLPDNHPAVLRHHAERLAAKTTEAARTKGVGKGGGKDLEWELEHYENFRAIGLPWPPAHYPLPGFAQSVEHMPEREAQLAWYCHQWLTTRVAAGDTGVFPRILDNNMSMGYVQRSLDAGYTCGTLVSTAKPVVVHEDGVRSICGLEVLHLQGLPPSDVREEAVADKNTNLIDLGGNAFNGFVCSALMLSILGSMDRAAVAMLLGLDATADADVDAASPRRLAYAESIQQAPSPAATAVQRSPSPTPAPAAAAAGRQIWDHIFGGFAGDGSSSCDGDDADLD